MSDKTDLIKYYPEFLQENLEFNAICDASNPEFDLIWRRIKQIELNIVPQTADSDGIAQYEQWLGIVTNPYLDLDTRRGQVISKLNETLPYTEIRLQRILAAIVGWGHFTYVRNGAFVQVLLDDESISASGLVYDMLERILPLNLHFEVTAGITDLTLIEFVGVCMETLIVETKINNDNEIASLYHGQPYLESATIETKLVGE